jgi:hypothetical protein
LVRKKNRYYNKELWQLVDNGSKRAITGWNIVKAAELQEYVGEEEVDFVDVRVVTPKLVRFMREFIDSPGGISAHVRPDRYIPQWIGDDEEELLRVVREMRLFEADVDFIIRTCVDLDWKPCNWYTVPLKKFDWKVRASQKKLEQSFGHWLPERRWNVVPSLPQKLSPRREPIPLHSRRRSRANFEGLVHYSHISRGQEQDPPNLKVGVMDSEWECKFGASFPDPSRDACIAITVDLYRENDYSQVRSYTFALKESEKSEKCHK